MDLASSKLKRLIVDVTSIPTLPEAMTRVNIVLSDPSAKAKDVARIISEDPALTFTLLKVVNSAYYGLTRKISQIDHAVTILGFTATYSLLMTTSVLSSFGSKSRRSPGFDYSKFWAHSIAVATASRLLAPFVGLKAQSEDLYVGGLLHDVGKIIIQQHDPEDFRLIMESVNQDGLRIQDAERKVLGFTHEEVGGLLASRWNLPQKLVAIISSHHEPLSMSVYQEHFKMTSAVHIADILCKMIDIGHSGDLKIPRLDLPAWELLKCDLNIADKVLYQLRRQKKSIEALSADIN